MLNALVSVGTGYYVFRKIRFPLNPFFFAVIETCAPVFSTLAILYYALFHLLIERIYEKKPNAGYRLPFGEKHYRDFISSQKIQLTRGLEKAEAEQFQIESYLDIIEGTDLDLKINAIGKLAQFRTKASITLLKLALNDDVYEVRYFASNSLAMVEKSLVSQIEAYNQNISQLSTDYQNFTMRGLSYLNMFYLGIIEKTIGSVFLEQALYNFIYSLQIYPDQPYLYVKMLEVYIHQKEFQRILELTPSILEKKLSEEERAKVLFYSAEAHFQTGNYLALREDCKNIQGLKIRIPLMQETVEMWSQAYE